MKQANEMLCDIGIYPEHEPEFEPEYFPDISDPDPSWRERLEARGCDVDHTPVDTFIERQDFGMSLSEED